MSGRLLARYGRLAFLAAWLSGCLLLLSGGAAFASGWDPPSFFFKPGLPRAGDRMIGSTDERFTNTEAMLLDAIEMMKAHPDWRFEISAHTDDRECVKEACQALSLRRAAVVRDWMLEHDAPASALKPLKAFGSTRPLDDNATRRGRRVNRRVELAVELPG